MYDGSTALCYGGKFNVPELHNGKPVKVRSIPYLYAGPGIDKTERYYQNVGEVIYAWMNEDPNNTISTLVYTANCYAEQRGIKARLKYSTIYGYLHGRFVPVYKKQMGRRVVDYYKWYGWQPKDIYLQLIEAALSIRHNEVTGYDPNTRFRAVAISPRGPKWVTPNAMVLRG